MKNTPFDFSTKETLGECYVSEHEQVNAFDGYVYRMTAKLAVIKVIS